jgi:hypothetical protein
MGSPIGFLYFIKKAMEAGPSKASLRYAEAMRSGTAAERLRERSRRIVRELLAFWILGTAAIGLCIGAMENVRDTRAILEFLLLLWVCGLFIPAWTLYRLIRFAIAR